MNIKLRALIFAIGIALLISLCSCAEKTDTDDSNTDASEVSEVSADALLGKFTTTDLDGNTVTESVIGECELTMVNIWGTFCGPCLNEMPDLGELAAEYADRGFQIIGIVCDVTDYTTGELDQSMVDYAKELVIETGADYLHIVPCDELNSAKLNDVMYIPETFFLDKNGEIVGESIIGSNTKDRWIEIIEEKFAELGLE